MTHMIDKFINNIVVQLPYNQHKSKRISDTDFTIPIYSEYMLLITNNYCLPQLKQMCKYYKLKGSGNKSVLINRIYRHLFLSKFALIVQKHIRGVLHRKWCKLHGPAYINRNICTNNTDFFTMQLITTIPITQFFSYKDTDNFIYGFDIISLYTLYQKSLDKNNTVLNPYNRNIFPPEILNTLRNVIRMSRVLKYDIKINIQEDEISPIKNLEFRIIALFQSMDELGNYTNPNWFNALSREKIVMFLRELYDIWAYRAQLSTTVKREIAPPMGEPFRGTNIQHLYQLPIYTIKNLAITIMEILVKSGINHDSQVLGANYVLCGLTLVNHDTAAALPWLYQSVAHIHY